MSWSNEKTCESVAKAQEVKRIADSHEVLSAFCKAGWKFSYCEQTRFISAEHPLGGKMTILEMWTITRTGGENINWHEVGHAITAWMNRGGE